MQLRRIGRYQLLEIVGRGGQGTVYRGHDPSTGQIVAVKILSENHSDGDFLERFQREASILASLDHPNVIKVFDHGEEEGRHYIVTEYVPENLARIIDQGDPLPLRRALIVASQIASALAVTHDNGITHRDVKPANVLMTHTGDIKLTDFGIATADVMNTVTTPDVAVGTPLYMSPEQIQSKEIDGRSDIYSLGCLLYQILTGIPPFRGENPYDIFSAHINSNYEPLSTAIENCPDELDQLVNKALEKNLEDRFQTADEFVDEILAVANEIPSTGEQTLETRVMPRTIRSMARRDPIWKRRNTWISAIAAIVVVGIIGFAASTMIGGGSAVGLATGVTETTVEPPAAQLPIVVPEAPVQDSNLPIAANILFTEGSDLTFVTAQIPVPSKADVAHLLKVSASTRSLNGNSAKLNVESVPTDTLTPPRDVLFLRSMAITISAGLEETDNLPGIIEFQIKKDWLDTSGIDSEGISLYRLRGDWELLPTTYKGGYLGAEDLLFERFSAETPGFSIFSIGIDTSKEQDATDQSSTQPQPELPLPSPTTISQDMPQTSQDLPVPSPPTTDMPQDTNVLPTYTPNPVGEETSEPTGTPKNAIGSYEGVSWGSAVVPDGNTGDGFFPVGDDLVLYYTNGDRDLGYLYSGSSGYPEPAVSFGRVPTKEGYCSYSGETEGGITGTSQANNLKDINYLNQTVEFIPLESSNCYSGVVPFTFNSDGVRYGLIDPLSIDESKTLWVNWWVGEPGVTDFSTALSIFRPDPTSTPVPTMTPTPTITHTPTPTLPTPTLTKTPTPTPIPNETVKDGTLIQLGIDTKAKIEYPGDVDEWIYVPSSSMVGKAVKIVVTSDSNDADGYLEFESPSGDLIADDDDSGPNLNPVINFAEISESGIYTIRFMLLDGTTSGYEMYVEAVDPALPTPTIIPTRTRTATPTISPTPARTPTQTPTPVITPTHTRTLTPTVTAIPSPTASPQPNSGGGGFNEPSDSNYQVENYHCDVTTLDHPVVTLCEVDGIVAATIVSGHINQLGDVDRFLINVEEGMLISTATDVDVGGSNLDPMLEIWKLGGSRLHWDRYTTTNSNLDNATIAGFLIEQGGPHEIVIKASDWLQEGSNEFTGQYDLYISITDPNKVAWRSNSEDLETGGGWQHISFGTSVNAALDKLGDIDDYHFDGNAGDTITVTFNKLESTFVAPLYPMIQIFPPSMNWYYSNTELQKSWDHECIRYGDYTMSSSVESLQCTLKESGAYTLRITTFNWESGFGPYKFLVDRAAAPTATPVPPTATPTPVPNPTPMPPTATPTPAPTNTPTASSGDTWYGTHGTAVMAESSNYDIGTGSRMWWSIADGKRGYFYSGQGVSVANVVAGGKGCNGTLTSDNGSYDGFESFSQLGNVATLTYTSATIGICSEDAPSYHGSDAQNDGLLIFRQNDQFGVMRFVSTNNGSMTIKWWLGAEGETDFRTAPNQ